ncbi:MAG: DUF2892 domain-containing protein [Candidatus Wallbacteria bacterium]|nr:DUF2892 domain-containing protein [Candidatus Wallbacteria bacterium]
MHIDRMIRGIAGAFVLLSVLLAVLVNSWWLAFTAFVGLNLLQSAFTDWCPMVWMLQRAGFKRAGGC